jgi:diguanylate cyclase (GGDEF)-like protein
MNDPVFILGVIVFHLIFISVFSYLYILEKKKYILLWSLSWVFFLLSSIFVGANLHTEIFLILVLFEKVFSLLGVYLISQGSFLFFRKKLSKLINITSTICLSLLIIAYLINLNSFYFDVTNALFSTCVLIYAGYSSLRFEYVKSGVRHLIGWIFFLWGFSTSLFLLSYFYGEVIITVAYTLMGPSAIAASITLLLAYFLHTREYRNTLDEKIRYINMYDSLTEVYNRSYCELLIEQLEQELQLPVSIVFGDLNNLKLINDIFGHHTGDDMIIRTADIIKRATMQTNGVIVSRWGGDEFIIILPNTNRNQAQAMIQKIKSLTDACRTDSFPLDISLGVATKESSEQSIQHVIKLADASLYTNKFRESAQAKKSIVEYFIKILFDNEIESKQHATRVQELALMISRELNLTQEQQEELSMVSYFHDIGKVSIPKEILNKSEDLTSDEWLTVKRHSEIGYRILQSSSEYAHISRAVLSHHEFWNGNGYPQNLKGEKIPLMARITAIAEAYEEMTHSKMYKVALTKEEALKEIEKNSGTQFDPNIARVFVEAMLKKT